MQDNRANPLFSLNPFLVTFSFLKQSRSQKHKQTRFWNRTWITLEETACGADMLHHLARGRARKSHASRGLRTHNLLFADRNIASLGQHNFRDIPNITQEHALIDCSSVPHSRHILIARSKLSGLPSTKRCLCHVLFDYNLAFRYAVPEELSKTKTKLNSMA
jgi:hypothetical protein